jgi:DNA-binding MarR family transcriptional regulator
MSNVTPTFDQRLIGQTEKTMNAILERLLAGSGVSEPEWVTLVLTAGGDGAVARDELAQRVAHGLKVDRATAESHVQALVTKGLLEASAAGDGSAVALTAGGRRLIDDVRERTASITQRLWGDLPDADLDVAARVLATVLERAEAELG